MACMLLDRRGNAVGQAALPALGRNCSHCAKQGLCAMACVQQGYPIGCSITCQITKVASLATCISTNRMKASGNGGHVLAEGVCSGRVASFKLVLHDEAGRGSLSLVHAGVSKEVGGGRCSAWPAPGPGPSRHARYINTAMPPCLYVRSPCNARIPYTRAAQYPDEVSH